MKTKTRTIATSLVKNPLFRRLAATTVVASAFLAAVASPMATAAPDTDGSSKDHMVISQTDAQALAAEKYWTPQRMMEADARNAEDNAIDNSVSPQSIGHPKRIGKIFYMAGGLGQSCTGTVIESHSRDAILTAGHCLRQKGSIDLTKYLTVFVPAYYKGQAPYGKWGIKNFWPGDASVPSKFWAGNNPSYDYGVIHVVSHTINNKQVRIQSVTGGNKLWAGASLDGWVTVVGYPHNKDYSVICGPTHATRHNISGHKPGYQFQCNGFTDGVSGSPLLIGPGDTAAGEGTVVGVLGGHHQGGDPSDANTSFATRVDDEMVKFWNEHTR